MRRMRISVSLLAGCVIAAWVIAVAVASPVSADEGISYRRQVWPILRRHCFACHSGEKPEGKLSLASAASIRSGGESGKLLVAGKPAASLLIKMVSGQKPAMPPKGTPLSAAKVEILRRWIAQGGKIDSVARVAEPPVVIPSQYTHQPAITSVAYSLDGKWVACACRSEVVLVSGDGPKGKQGNQVPVRLATGADLITHVEFSPDGKLLVAAGGSPARFGLLTVFDMATHKVVSTRRVSGDTVFRGAFSPDGKSIALGGADGAIHIVPLEAKAKLRRFELHSDWVVDVAWTPNGKYLVTAGRDKATKVADVATGKLLRTVDASSERTMSVVCDDMFAVSAGKSKAMTSFQLGIALQNIGVTGAGNGAKPISRRNQYAKGFEAQPGEVLDMALSGDRKRVAVAGRFGEVRVYTLADRKRVAAVSGVRSPVYGVALNRDGTRVAVAGREGVLEVFGLPDGKKLQSVVPVPIKPIAASR